MNHQKYKAYPTMNMPKRNWPNNIIDKAPIWCSVDLRDGNQSLEVPMSLEQKIDFFNFLVKMGFKEIEIGFPAASDTEFEFARHLIENNLIPDDVIIQVLTQSREHIIKRTFEALAGAKQAIVHLYNSTSTLQRDVVFGNSKQKTIELATFGAKLVLEEEKHYPQTKFYFEYSPESFTGTEIDFAAQICNAVIDIWQPTADKKVIINLPATVEMSTPNIYADQIEYMGGQLNCRNNIIISLHTHNDRGTAVAATELALMAGADRVEGTLFGNGERTGNADILTLGLNLFSQGVDPKLDFSHINQAIDIYESVTAMPVHPRHPYAGDLVYTAFSGSHQDAIKKGMGKVSEHPDYWQVPYLPIDPLDVGRNYDPIIRINSQSGKGGVAFILEQNYGLFLPRAFQQDFSRLITKLSDREHNYLTADKIYQAFIDNYVDIREPLVLKWYDETFIASDKYQLDLKIEYQGEEKNITGIGNGVIAAMCNALDNFLGLKIEIFDYREHSMEQGTKARAISYIECGNGHRYFGAGTSSNITKSSLRAVISAANQMLQEQN